MHSSDAATGQLLPPRMAFGPTVKRHLRDEHGLRIVHCDNEKPHGFHGWVGANEDLRCPGVATYKDGQRV